MKQPEDNRTAELPGLPSLAQLQQQRASLQAKAQRMQPRGPYPGAVKIGAPNHAIRVTTGNTQAEFAALAGISERTLRTWEQGAGRIKDSTHLACVKALASLGVTYAAALQRRPVRYRDPRTGDTWSGRGLMPRWLRARLDQGHKLQDFAA